MRASASLAMRLRTAAAGSIALVLPTEVPAYKAKASMSPVQPTVGGRTAKRGTGNRPSPTGASPDRLHLIELVTDLQLRFLRATLEWAEEAQARTAGWRSTTAGTDPRPAIEARRRATLEQLGGDPV